MNVTLFHLFNLKKNCIFHLNVIIAVSISDCPLIFETPFLTLSPDKNHLMILLLLIKYNLERNF